MDIFAHAIWSYLIFSEYGKWYFVVLFGILPDLIPFTLPFIYGLLKNGFDDYKKWNNIKENKPKIPQYVFFIYDITHSFFTVGLVALLLYIFVPQYTFLALAWLVHILVDIPSHTKDFFPTHIFFPFSMFCIDGVSWAEKKSMLVNYCLIVIVFILKMIFGF